MSKYNFLTFCFLMFLLYCSLSVQARLYLTQDGEGLKPDQVSLLDATIYVIQRYSSPFRKIILVNHYESLYTPQGPSDVENITNYILSHSNLLSQLDLPILIMSSDQLMALQGFFVVFTDRVDEAFTDMFANIHLSKDNRFLVIVLGDHQDNVRDLFTLFYEFLRLHILSVVVLMKRMDSTYAYFCHPFSKNVTIADVWLSDVKKIKKGIDLYDDLTKTRDMHGFKLRCIVKNKPPDTAVFRRNNRWEYDGLGVNLLWEVSKTMNFTPDIIFPVPESPLNVDRFGYDISPYMDTLIIGALTLREVDLAFGVFSHLLYVSPTTDLSSPAADECFTFAVPSDAGWPTPMWSDFINEFRPAVWCCLALTFIANAAVWYAAAKWQTYKASILLSNPRGDKENNCTTHGRSQAENNVSDSILSMREKTFCGKSQTSYRNPLLILTMFFQNLMQSCPRLLKARKRPIEVVNENVVFKRNYRHKLTRLVSNARELLSRQNVEELKRQNQDEAVNNQKVSLVQVVFLEIALTLGSSSLNKVSTNWLMRFLFAQYIVFCLITSQAYLGSLGSFMTYPNEKNQIRTPEELYARNLKLIGVPQSKVILKRAYSKNEVLKKLSERWVTYEGHFEDLLLMLHKERNTSTFATSRFLQFYITNNAGLKNKSDSIFLFPQCTVRSYSSPFLFQRGSPFIVPVNKILYRITESGITRKWFDTATPRKMVTTRDPVQRLGLGQIQGCFVTLVLLHGVSLLVFVGELIVHVCQVQRKLNNG